jgi:hypothetical protein
LLASAFGGLTDLVAGCVEPAPLPVEYPPMEASAVMSSVGAPATDPAPIPTAVSAFAVPAPPVQVVLAEDTPLAGAPPVLHIRSPRDGQVLTSETVELSLELTHWPLGDDGSYVQLYIDDEPYIAIRELARPIDLRALLRQARGHDLSPGTHLVRVIASRGQHETVKTAQAFALTQFHFRRRTAPASFDRTAPRLGFAAPNDCVELGTRVLLDFFLENVQLAKSGSRLHYSIDDVLEGDLVQSQPHYIENLPAGEHRIRLSLRDPAGNTLPGPFSAAQHTILVAHDCKTLTSAVDERATTLAGMVEPTQSPEPVAPSSH